jgi:transposase InsO family protein
MPWRKVDVSEQRLQFVMAASAPGSCVAALSREFGISRQTGHTWLQRFREGGVRAVLSERSRRPHQIPRRTPAELVEAIKKARQDRPDWGARKLLSVILGSNPELARSHISVTTTHRILEREHLIAPEDRHKPALQRFERQAPNELWQMDFKGPQGFNKGTGPLSVQDDFSRFLLVLKHLGSTQLKGVQLTLQATFESCGLPEFLLIDHGTPWYNSWNPWGWTELTVSILRQGIRIVLSGVRHPQTQGKVERMHGALQRAISKRKAAADQQEWLDQFRHEYNHVRPHEGIGMVAPATRWKPSPRPFQPNPREWEYPGDWQVHRLGGQGQLWWRAKRWEISRALRGQLVGLQRAGDRVLVHFCNLALREIDLRTGQNLVLPVNPFPHLQC